MATLPLRDIPQDVREILLKEQAKKKIEKKVSQYSLAATIYHIVREYGKKS